MVSVMGPKQGFLSCGFVFIETWEKREEPRRRRVGQDVDQLDLLLSKIDLY
jgi:hypothetical protein